MAFFNSKESQKYLGIGIIPTKGVFGSTINFVFIKFESNLRISKLTRGS